MSRLGIVRSSRIVGIVVVLSLLGAGCGSGEEADEARRSGTVAAAPTFPPGTTMAEVQKRGRLRIGTKFDQPGFGQRNPSTGELEGFDIEMAKLVAAGIFGDDKSERMEFVEAISKNREPLIQEGRVDIVVQTYTITDARKQVIDFAGPYFVAHQDIMVRSDETAIRSVQDLNGRKVCTIQGTTSTKNVEARAPQADLSITLDSSTKCAAALTDKRVDAVSTDDIILAGLAGASGGALKLANAPFTDEPAGIGLRKGDTAFREFVNGRLEAVFADGSWMRAFERTLGRIGLGVPASPPRIDRYP